MTATPRVPRPTVVFLDRDGTIIRDAHYLSDPDRVELIPGAAEAIARMNRAGVPVILITNQSGIGRGYFTDEAYQRVHARLVALLAERGATLDGAYYCPHAPEMECACRKPGIALFTQAMAEHHLAGGTPLFIGDRWRDIAAARTLGGVGILIPSSDTPADDLAWARGEAQGEASSQTYVADTLSDAVQLAFGQENAV